MIDIYSKDNCAFCKRAKTLMDNRGIRYNEYTLGVDFESDLVRETFPMMRTFPIIVKDGVVLGGYDALVERVMSDENFGLFLINE